MTTDTLAMQAARLTPGDPTLRALLAGAYPEGRWFGGVTYRFSDDSTLTMRFGKVESPRPPIEWTDAKRIEWDV